MSENPRIVRAISQLRQAWELLRDLQELKRDFQDRRGGGGTPTERRMDGYSRLVQNLEVSLNIALRTAVVDLNARGDWNILPEVLPSTKDFTDEQWLKWLGDQLGPGPPRRLRARDRRVHLPALLGYLVVERSMAGSGRTRPRRRDGAGCGVMGCRPGRRLRHGW